MTIEVPAQPDLLQRFVDTPIHAVIAVENEVVDVQTNDHGLASALVKTFPVVPASSPGWTCRIVRDLHASVADGDELKLITSHIEVIRIGHGTLICCDHECHVILAFIAADMTIDSSVTVLSSCLHRIIASNPRFTEK